MRPYSKYRCQLDIIAISQGTNFHYNFLRSWVGSGRRNLFLHSSRCCTPHSSTGQEPVGGEWEGRAGWGQAGRQGRWTR